MILLSQMDWNSIRDDYPDLNASQVQQLLGEYQLGGKKRPRGWYPPPEEVEAALRSCKFQVSHQFFLQYLSLQRCFNDCFCTEGTARNVFYRIIKCLLPMHSEKHFRFHGFDIRRS